MRVCCLACRCLSGGATWARHCSSGPRGGCAESAGSPFDSVNPLFFRQESAGSSGAFPPSTAICSRLRQAQLSRRISLEGQHWVSRLAGAGSTGAHQSPSARETWRRVRASFQAHGCAPGSRQSFSPARAPSLFAASAGWPIRGLFSGDRFCRSRSVCEFRQEDSPVVDATTLCDSSAEL